MQVLKLISSLVFMIQPLCALSRRLGRLARGAVWYVRPSSALTRACYVLLGIILLLAAMGAEQDGYRNHAIALAAVGAIFLLLQKLPPLVAMRGTVKWYNDLKGFGFIEPDAEFKGLAGHDEPLLLHVGDIVDFGQWCRHGARVAFKSRHGKGTIATRCLRVTQADHADAGYGSAPNGAQVPSDLLRSGWVQKGVAVDKAGNPVMSDDPSAVAWSLCGAVNAIYEPSLPLWKSYMAALQAQVGHNLVRWSGDSGRTQDDIIAVALEAEKIVKAPNSGGQ